MQFPQGAPLRTPTMCLLALWVPVIVTAQGLTLPPVITSNAPLTPLTIDAAVHEALDRNLTLLAERYSMRVADAHVVAARLRPNPVLTYNALLPDGAIYDKNVNPLENVIRADVIFEGGGKRDRRIEVANAARSVAQLQLANTMRTIVLDVQSAFVDVVLAQTNVALARESLQAFDNLVQVNVVRVRSGDLAPVELARSRLAALQFQNDVRQQESKLTIARTRLRTLLGRTDLEPIVVSGELRRDPLTMGLEGLRARAELARPDLEALRRDQARSTADIRLQMAQGKIDFTLSGEFHRQRAPITTGNEYGVYLSAPLPIFNRNQGEVERARAEEQQIEARIHALDLEVSNQVQAAYEACTAARDVMTAVETQMLSQARDVRATTEYSYRRGEASFVEYLDAARAFNETMQSYNDARAEYARSLYTLESATGASVAEMSASKETP